VWGVDLEASVFMNSLHISNIPAAECCSCYDMGDQKQQAQSKCDDTM
jgi:hypothetical protein